MGLPAVVAVHGPVAADDRRDAPHADLLDLRFDLAHIVDARERSGVAPVGEEMDADAVGLESLALRQFEQGVEVFETAVHARIRTDAQQVQAGAGVLGAAHRFEKDFVAEERAVADRLADAHRVLIHDAPGAEVLVPDFAVAGGAFGDADLFAARVDERGGILAHQLLGHGSLGKAHGVEGVVLAVGVGPPAVADDEDQRGVAETWP